MLKTLAELAAAVKSPLSTVGGWVKHDGWRWERKAPWKSEIVPEVLRWAADELAKGRPGLSDEVGGDDGSGKKKNETQKLRDEKLRQEIRKLRAHADGAEAELAKQRGELIPAAEVERDWVRVGIVIRNALENLPSQIIPLAQTHGMPHEASGQLQAQVEELVAGVLRQLSVNGHRQAVGVGGSPGDGDDGEGE